MKLKVGRARSNATVVPVLVLLCVCGTPRAWSQDGGRIVFGGVSGATAHIFLTTPDGANLERLTPRGARHALDEFPAWSPDGRAIAFSGEANGEPERLYVMDTDGSNARAVSDGPRDYAPTWSPDGRAIAFMSGREGPVANERLGVYKLLLDSRRQARLTDMDSVGVSPSWRPGGGAIAYSSNRKASYDLHLMDEHGVQLIQLTDRETSDSSPRWHPREDVIAFVAQGSVDADGNTPADIHTIRADGSDERRLTTHPAEDWEPSWSPNGRELLFTSRRDGRGALYIMNSDGRGIRRITDGRFTGIWGSDWFDADYPRSVSPIGRQATTWGWFKRLGAPAQ